MEAQPAKMTTITLVLSGALVLSAVPPSIAAPIPSNPVVMKTAAQGSVTNVRSRHHAWHNDGWVAGAIIGGLALARRTGIAAGVIDGTVTRGADHARRSTL
jgi:hypothetical protein